MGLEKGRLSHSSTNTISSPVFLRGLGQQRRQLRWPTQRLGSERRLGRRAEQRRPARLGLRRRGRRGRASSRARGRAGAPRRRATGLGAESGLQITVTVAADAARHAVDSEEADHEK